ncbi:TIGR04076 family protein [Occultella kanbiaonis]|uniref:TIGR04076 family protein n=1 Tax=Occultella kanbiaonis TaxID=2675754 RepID=UPI0012B84F72|nr:TIGR04076 family protein [Occultella kanbiaonis]
MSDDTGDRAGKTAAGRRTELSDLRVVVDRIEGRSVCGLAPGDSFDVSCSSRLTIPEGRHFCIYALSAVLPLLPAAQRSVDPDDWLASDEVACPDPEERLIMRIERLGRRSIPTEELT